MSEKSALFMARTTRFHEFARSLTTTLGVEVSLATPDSPTAAHDFDLLILDSDGIRSDVLNIDNLEINLATYQVTLDDEPIDLTLMEYSLLSFLATHPNRAYSREVLLHRVWGFEYCGGTRTVDVHIRRIRSKVGPQIAAHITTVRGVGYLFKD